MQFQYRFFCALLNRLINMIIFEGFLTQYFLMGWGNAGGRHSNPFKKYLYTILLCHLFRASIDNAERLVSSVV